MLPICRQHRSDPRKLVAQSVGNTTLVAVEAYDKPATKKFLDRYAVPIWNADGYVFTEDAFDHILDLEPGAWIQGKRKTLPYLAVGLGDDTIQTTQGGERQIADTAECALRAFNQLLNEERQLTSASLFQQFRAVLEQSQKDIEELIKRPAPQEQDGKKVLTRAHVVAQLICHNDSEFHFPGLTPALVKKGQPRTGQPRKTNQHK